MRTPTTEKGFSWILGFYPGQGARRLQGMSQNHHFHISPSSYKFFCVLYFCVEKKRFRYFTAVANSFMDANSWWMVFHQNYIFLENPEN